MGEQLLSVGIDIGTSTTQLILSRLTLENRAAQGSIRSRIRYDNRFHGCQVTVFITCCSDIHPHGMTFRMYHDTFLAG